jgi:hypothetical protein
VSALAHYIEAAGVPTVAISLIRPHSEKIRNPRSLWVPFELGRPLGPADDAPFQTGVIAAALRLLESRDGPVVLADYDKDDPTMADAPGWAPPFDLPPPPSQPPPETPAKAESSPSPSANSSKPSGDRLKAAILLGQSMALNEALNALRLKAEKALAPDASDPAALAAALTREIATVAPFNARFAAARGGRTTVGISGLAVEACASHALRALAGPLPPSAIPDMAPPQFLRFVLDDLKAFVLEAASAGPGTPSSRQMQLWFWDNTATARLAIALRAAMIASADERTQAVGRLNIVPGAQAGRLRLG